MNTLTPDDRARRFLASLRISMGFDSVTIAGVDLDRLTRMLALVIVDAENAVATAPAPDTVARLQDIIRRAGAGDLADMYKEAARLSPPG